MSRALWLAACLEAEALEWDAAGLPTIAARCRAEAEAALVKPSPAVVA